MGGPVDAGGGDIVITTDQIRCPGGCAQRLGNLLLQPLSPSSAIGLGDDAHADRADAIFHLGSSELAHLIDGFGGDPDRPHDGIVFGRADGSHAVEVGTHAFRDSITVRSPQQPGEIHVVGFLNAIGDAQIRFQGSHHTTTLMTETHTEGVDWLFEDSANVGAGDSALISSGPLGGSITIDGNVDGVADVGNLSEDLTIEAGTGDVIILGDVGLVEPLRNLTIVSARNVTIYGNVFITGEFKVLNTTGKVRIGVARQNTAVGNTTAGSIDIRSGSEISFEGNVQTTDAGAATSIRVSAPNPASGNIVFKQTVTANGDLVVESARNVLFSDVVSVSGSAAGFRLHSDPIPEGGSADDIDLQAASVTFDSALSVGEAGNVLLTADEIDFKGGNNTVTSAGMNTSRITLRPISPLTQIRVGSAAGVNSGILDLNNQDILAIADKFNEVYIGWEGAADPVAAGSLTALTAIAGAVMTRPRPMFCSAIPATTTTSTSRSRRMARITTESLFASPMTARSTTPRPSPATTRAPGFS